MIYIGIDPGVSGGIAAVDEHGIMQLAQPMPETEKDLLMVLKVCGINGGARALLERVSASPQMGVVSAFTFGRGYGKLEMALIAAEIPHDYIRPQKWQTMMGCLSGGDKNVTKRRAQQLFPSVAKVTHAIADALLLAECCRRLEKPNGKEESRGAQAHTEAPTGSKAWEVKTITGGERGGKTARLESAVATAPRHGAGPQRAPR